MTAVHSFEYPEDLPVKIYRMVKSAADKSRAEFIAKFRVFLQDRPGSLADFASLIVQFRGNISFFHYDRSVHSNRVVVEVQMSGRSALHALLESLQDAHMFREITAAKEDIQIISLESVLEIKVRLRNEPGTLAAFANLLKAHGANVIHMLYDEDIDPESATVAMATRELTEINRVLDAMNRTGYYYRVLYRGTDEKEVEHIIGLKLVEKLFLKLRRILPDREFDELKSIVDSSQELSADLIHFYEEAGNSLESGDVFEKILTLASGSRTRVAERFSAIEMPAMQFGDTKLFSFRLPTTENVFLFHSDEEVVMIDAGYGVYYEDIKRLLRDKSLDPSMVRRIYLTHPDADHAGTSGYFAEEFGTEVLMHPACEGVIENQNRAYGIPGRLSNLNRYYTRLINTFTASQFPRKKQFFHVSDSGKAGAFTIIDYFSIGKLNFEILESHGGHIPGHVFFLNREYGLVFTSDFLINVQSLSEEDRDILGVYRYLLTNPNSDSTVYKKESEALRDVIIALNNDLKQSGKYAVIFPGHGAYYRADRTPAFSVKKTNK